MDLSKYLAETQVLLDCKAADKPAVIHELLQALLASPLFKNNPDLSPDSLEKALNARELERPTVVAPGVACPHARIPGLSGIGVAVAVLKNPIDFGDPKGELVNIVVLLVAPMERPPLALKLIANVASFGNPEKSAPLLNAKSTKEAVEYLHGALLNIDAPLRARDFMRPPLCLLTPDTSVTLVVKKMVEYGVDTMGIVDADGKLLGEITSDRLFMLGMPEFFSQLKSVSFILEFDPFDRYFDKESKQNAGEVLSSDVAKVEPDATVLEVIFLLAVKRYAKVYVVSGGKLVGVIDRSLVLNEILNT